MILDVIARLATPEGCAMWKRITARNLRVRMEGSAYSRRMVIGIFMILFLMGNILVFSWILNYGLSVGSVGWVFKKIFNFENATTLGLHNMSQNNWLTMRTKLWWIISDVNAKRVSMENTAPLVRINVRENRAKMELLAFLWKEGSLGKNILLAQLILSHF